MNNAGSHESLIKDIRDKTLNYVDMNYEGFKDALNRMRKQKISDNVRKKDEPFNPFARDASAQRKKRMSDRNRLRKIISEHAKCRKEFGFDVNIAENEIVNITDIRERFVTKKNQMKLSAKKRENKRGGNDNNSKANAKKYQSQRNEKRLGNEKSEKDKNSYYAMKKSLTKETKNPHIPEKRKRDARKNLDRLIKQNGKKFGDKDAE